MKFMIIDDNKKITDMLSKILRWKGHQCVVSNSGRNGLALLQEQKFDATVLDMGMPDFCGFDVINSLEKSGKLKEQKIVVLTGANISDDQMDEMERRGIRSCLKKPVSLEILFQILEN